MIVEFGAFAHGRWVQTVCCWVEGGMLKDINACVSQETRLNSLRLVECKVVPDRFEDEAWRPFTRLMWANSLELTAANLEDDDRRVLVWCEPRGGCCVVV